MGVGAVYANFHYLSLLECVYVCVRGQCDRGLTLPSCRMGPQRHLNEGVCAGIMLYRTEHYCVKLFQQHLVIVPFYKCLKQWSQQRRGTDQKGQRVCSLWLRVQDAEPFYRLSVQPGT